MSTPQEETTKSTRLVVTKSISEDPSSISKALEARAARFGVPAVGSVAATATAVGPEKLAARAARFSDVISKDKTSSTSSGPRLKAAGVTVLADPKSDEKKKIRAARFSGVPMESDARTRLAISAMARPNSKVKTAVPDQVSNSVLAKRAARFANVPTK